MESFISAIKHLYTKGKDSLGFLIKLMEKSFWKVLESLCYSPNNQPSPNLYCFVLIFHDANVLSTKHQWTKTLVRLLSKNWSVNLIHVCTFITCSHIWGSSVLHWIQFWSVQSIKKYLKNTLDLNMQSSLFALLPLTLYLQNSLTF